MIWKLPELHWILFYCIFLTLLAIPIKSSQFLPSILCATSTFIIFGTDSHACKGRASPRSLHIKQTGSKTINFWDSFKTFQLLKLPKSFHEHDVLRSSHRSSAAVLNDRLRKSTCAQIKRDIDGEWKEWLLGWAADVRGSITSLLVLFAVLTLMSSFAKQKLCFCLKPNSKPKLEPRFNPCLRVALSWRKPFRQILVEKRSDIML